MLSMGVGTGKRHSGGLAVLFVCLFYFVYCVFVVFVMDDLLLMPMREAF